MRCGSRDRPIGGSKSVAIPLVQKTGALLALQRLVSNSGPPWFEELEVGRMVAAVRPGRIAGGRLERRCQLNDSDISRFDLPLDE